MAVATDWNRALPNGVLTPGHEHVLHAVWRPGALAGTTRNAARASIKDCGIVAPGKRADLAIWDI